MRQNKYNVMLKTGGFYVQKKPTFLSLIIIALIVFSSINISVEGKEAKNIFPGRDNLERFLDNSYSQLYCVMPSNAVVGQPIRITIQAWDWAERICKKQFKNSITFSSTDDDATLPEDFSFKFRDLGTKTIENSITFSTPGIHYIKITDKLNDIWAAGNPVLVTEKESEYKWYWGELHCHSTNSDGSGTLNHNYKYARDTSILDFCAYTDHDRCFGNNRQTLWMKLFRWRKAKEAVHKFYEPGRFVTLLAYEYTNDVGAQDDGHYIVYYNTVDNAPFYSCVDKQSDRIFELWSLLKDWKNETGNDVFTVPHHLIALTMEWNSEYYDPEMVPLVEIFQIRGSSEMRNCEGNPVPFVTGETNESGHSVQDGLAKGYKFGFIAGSDDHTGHPGHHLPVMRAYLTEPAAYIGPFLFAPRMVFGNKVPLHIGITQKLFYLRDLLTNNVNKEYTPGGLTGVKAKELSRGGIFDALKNRRCVAVSNLNRMIVNFTVNDKEVGDGSEVYVPDINTPRIINCSIAGTAPIKNITVVKNNQIFYVEPGKGLDPNNFSNYKLNFSILDTEPITGTAWDEENNTGGRDFYYLRVLQINGWAGWVGPIWVNPLNVV